MNNQINNDQVGLNLPPPVVDPDDPLLIAQTLTYVTDDGSVLLSFTSAPFSFGKKNTLLYTICILCNCFEIPLLLIYCAI